MLTLSDPGGGFSVFVPLGFEVVCVEGVIYKANKQCRASSLTLVCCAPHEGPGASCGRAEQMCHA